MILASDIEHARWGAKALGRHGYTALGKAVERLATFAAYAKSAPTKTPDKAVEIPKAPPKRRSRDAEPTRLEIDDSSRGHETWFLENARDKAIEHFGWDEEKWRWICGTGRSYGRPPDLAGGGAALQSAAARSEGPGSAAPGHGLVPGP